MKVLFLDHDGVICLYNEYGSRFSKQSKYGTINALWGISNEISVYDMPVFDRFDNFNQDSVNILNDIILETDCELVTSSDWRNFATLDEMGDYYESQGIIKRPIGFTPKQLPSGLKFYNRNYELEETRSYEILHWLDTNPQLTHWVAVDDMDMRNFRNGYESNWGLKNFVWTVDGETFGILQKGIKEKIIEYLI